MIPRPSPEFWPTSSLESSADPRPGIWFSLALLTLACGLNMSARFWLSAPWNDWFQPLPLDSPLDLLVLFTALLSVVVIHECGHLLTAFALGFEFTGVALGPWRLQVLHGRWKCHRRSQGMGCASISASPTDMIQWRRATMTVIAAGPLATLAALAFSFAWRPLTHAALIFTHSFVQISFLILILGLIPKSCSATAANDARMLLNLLCRNSGADEMELAFLLRQQIRKGFRPADYPLELMARLARWVGHAEAGIVFAHALSEWALDGGNFNLADAWDRRALALAERSSVDSRMTALAHSACLDVTHRKDLEAAQNKFAQVDFRRLFPPCFEHRARAAKQLAIGRNRSALPEILRAQFALAPGRPYYELERALLDRLHMMALHRDEPQTRHFAAAAD